MKAAAMQGSSLTSRSNTGFSVLPNYTSTYGPGGLGFEPANLMYQNQRSAPPTPQLPGIPNESHQAVLLAGVQRG